MANAVLGSFAVRVWEWEVRVPHDWLNIEECKAEEAERLMWLWEKYVLRDSEPSDEDEDLSPRYFMRNITREKIRETVKHRLFRHLASLNTSEFRQHVVDARERYEYRLNSYLEEDDC